MSEKNVERMVDRVSYDDLPLSVSTAILPRAIYDWVKPISDAEAADFGPGFVELARRWRHLDDDHFQSGRYKYDGPIAWRIQPGYTLKQHTPITGKCFEKLWYLQSLVFDDQPTGNWVVFGIPQVLDASLGLAPKKQRQLLKALRQTYQLPDHHLSSFGQASLIAGLMLARRAQVSWLPPVNTDDDFVRWARTETAYQRVFRINFCIDPDDGLCTDGAMALTDQRYHARDAWSFYCINSQGNAGLGVFPFGIEPVVA